MNHNVWRASKEKQDTWKAFLQQSLPGEATNIQTDFLKVNMEKNS